MYRADLQRKACDGAISSYASVETLLDIVSICGCFFVETVCRAVSQDLHQVHMQTVTRLVRMALVSLRRACCTQDETSRTSCGERMNAHTLESGID